MTKDTRGSITTFDSNPEGINQYSGAAAAVKEASAKAEGASNRAAQGDKAPRDYGTANGGRHSDAAALHTAAASAQRAASQSAKREATAAYTRGNESKHNEHMQNANAHLGKAEYHDRQAANHEKKMNP